MRTAVIMTAILITLTTMAPSFAAGVLDGLLACRKIEGAAERLACFDRESATIRAPQAAGAVHAALNPRRTFGLAPAEITARAEAAAQVSKPLEAMSAHIAALSRSADGREIFTLDDQQVWMELVGGEQLDARAGEVVKISRGWLGSYWLALPSRRGCKVTRLR